MVNYQKIHDFIVERGRFRNKADGLFKHRIIPGHEGGKYVTGNITYVTLKEHRIVHNARYKLFGKIEDRWAVNFMRGQGIGP